MWDIHIYKYYGIREVTMNYIIFGGSGFIGTHLIKLIKQGCLKENDKIYDLDIVMPGEEGVVPGG